MSPAVPQCPSASARWRLISAWKAGALPALRSIFVFRFGSGLPLHVVDAVGAAFAQRHVGVATLMVVVVIMVMIVVVVAVIAAASISRNRDAGDGDRRQPGKDRTH